MKVENLKNSPNFGIKIDRKLVKNADRFFTERALPIQSEKFHKTLRALNSCGQKRTVILHREMVGKDDKKFYVLCLKNEKLNKKKALLLTKTNKFNEILKYFNTLTCEAVESMEKMLSNLNK